jgi:hypothetical protein
MIGGAAAPWIAERAARCCWGQANGEGRTGGLAPPAATAAAAAGSGAAAAGSAKAAGAAAGAEAGGAPEQLERRPEAEERRPDMLARCAEARAGAGGAGSECHMHAAGAAPAMGESAATIIDGSRPTAVPRARLAAMRTWRLRAGARPGGAAPP